MEMMLIRHGRPDDAAHEADPGLSVPGREAAERLAEHLAGGAVRRPDAVWSSPMRRALETAAPLAQRLGVAVRTDERLREFDHGAPVYVAADEASAEARAGLWRALETGWWGEHRFDPEAFARGVDAALDDIAAAHPHGTVAVVCHSGVINAHLCSVLGRPRGMFCQLEHTSFSRLLVSTAGRRQVHSVNETAHLQAARQAQPSSAASRVRPSERIRSWWRSIQMSW